MNLIGSKDFNDPIGQHIDMLMDSLQVVLTGRDNLEPPDLNIVKDLALELGCKTLIIHDKIQNLFK